LREEAEDLDRLGEDPVRMVLSQPHSTALPSPKRYDKRYEQELQEERSMPAPATHEDMGWHRGRGGDGKPHRPYAVDLSSKASPQYK
jgi:hypothetical protein